MVAKQTEKTIYRTVDKTHKIKNSKNILYRNVNNVSTFLVFTIVNARYCYLLRNYDANIEGH